MPTSRPTLKENPYRTTGTILVFFGVILLVGAVVIVFTSTSPYTIIVAALPLVVGLIGFSQLKIANKRSQIQPVVFELDLLGTVLKAGTPFHVLVEITFLPAPGPPQALERIKSRLQRAINIYASKTSALSDDPFTEFDNVLQVAIDPIPDELGLDELTLNTIDVKLEGSPHPPARGLVIGGQH